MESYVERPPLPDCAEVVRTVWIQRTAEAAYMQRHLPTGGVEIHFPKDVALMGGGHGHRGAQGGARRRAHPPPGAVLLGAGRSFFHELPEHVQLHLLEAIPAPGVTHLHYEVVR